MTDIAAKFGGRAIRGLWICVPVLLLTACLGSEERTNVAQAPAPVFTDISYNTGVDANSVMQANALTPAARAALVAATSSFTDSSSESQADPAGPQESYSQGCSMRDRFDRGETLAYNFSDNQTRLGLKVSTDGVSTVKALKLQLTYHFQKTASTKHCRFDSPVQGLVGSVYNEMFLRQKQTIWNDLSDRGADFWRR